jgi:hypothetical protein
LLDVVLGRLSVTEVAAVKLDVNGVEVVCLK